jgi:stage II sporulation protein AA (anti-sigma F factor antagonist)
MCAGTSGLPKQQKPPQKPGDFRSGFVPGGHVMASNFHVVSKRSRKGLVLDLSGDFDATSAYELIHVLKKSSEDSSNVFIQTYGLKKIYPIGLEVFRKSLRIGAVPAKIVFVDNKKLGDVLVN